MSAKRSCGRRQKFDSVDNFIKKTFTCKCQKVDSFLHKAIFFGTI